MSLLRRRDEIFRSLHAEFLKPLGYRLRSICSERHDGPVHRAVACRAFDSSSSESIDFDIELRASHDEYNPFASFGAKSGVGQKDIQLIACSLRQCLDPARRFWTIRAAADLPIVKQEVYAAFRQAGGATLERMGTLEGIADLYAERGAAGGFQERSWTLLRLGRQQEARHVVQQAIDAAPDDNARTYAVRWLEQIGA